MRQWLIPKVFIQALFGRNQISRFILHAIQGGTFGPHLPGGPPNSEPEITREQWAAGFVQICLDKGLKAIAVTDHHDTALIPYVQRAIELAGKSDDLWLFPGMEVTCDDATQCLVLFDRSTSSNLWRRLFGGHLQRISELDPLLAEVPQADLCGKNIKDFALGLQKDPSLSDMTIVLPHAGESGSHKGVIRQGYHERFATLDVDGVYTELEFGKLSPSTREKIYGKTQHWGKRRRGIITTGDNRSADYASLGAHPCWIRLGEPTTESVRQALLADEARISYSEPSLGYVAVYAVTAFLQCTCT